MSETAGTPELNKALAALQADLPHVGKDLTAEAGQYSYDYADLTAVSKALMPKMGKLGLSFSALPTLNAEGRFVLSYSLLHSSGQEKTGEYVLPDKGSPQQIGSAITYARRYSLCAVTGLAPGGDDDDGAAAEQGAREHPQEQSRPRQRQTRPAQEPEADPWLAKIDEITSQEDADRIDAELKAEFDAERIDGARAGRLHRAVLAKAASLNGNGAEVPS